MALAEPAPNAPPAPPPRPLPAPRSGLGRFFALVIGNSQYDHLPPVPSAEHDARAMQALLHDAYGFQVTLLLNAKSAQILSTLHTLSQTLDENDNLVVFYAGHGRRDLRNRRGWWLAADADPSVDAKTNWIPNQEVSDRLALIAARHILVLADASYVGDITRGAPQPEPQRMTAAQWTQYVETTKRRRARLALSSGADEPLSVATPAPPVRAPASRRRSSASSSARRASSPRPAPSRGRQRVDVRRAGHFRVPTFAPLQSPSTTASTSCSSANELAPGDRQPIRRSGQLGEGGMGCVYKVRHRDLDEVQIVKTLQAHLSSNEALRSRFINEARRGMRLRHPHIAGVHRLPGLRRRHRLHRHGVRSTGSPARPAGRARPMSVSMVGAIGRADARMPWPICTARSSVTATSRRQP